MASSSGSTEPVRSAARTGVIGAVVAAFAFFDGVFLGVPIAVLAASLRPLVAYILAVIAAALLSIACCSWVDRRWDDWFSGNAKRIEKRMEAMRASRLMRHPVGWIQRGSESWYALAAALANPILVAALARSIGGVPVGRRRILLGSVAYAIPYAAIWTLVGLTVSDTISAA
ncbi:MAG: hypothetical protein C5B48_03680 [Candidatus Rokuibacteriota bacterium]|nr:MAG: hypothetical protein C5B48_03680 [Candidatus Rokubacteria bacterium]